MRIHLLLVCVVMTLASSDAHAQRAAGDDAGQYVLRTYEVGDLILSINDRPYSDAVRTSFGAASYSSGGGMGGGGFGGGVFGGGGAGGDVFGQSPGVASSNSTTVTMDSLIDAIVTVIAHDSWSENGGDNGQITPVGAALVVSQVPAAHQQIEALLSSLRKGSGSRRTLRIDARWLLLNSNDLDELLSGEEGRIDRAALEGFTRRPSNIRGITNCFSGQLVYVASGTRRNVVQSYIPVVGSIDDVRGEERQFVERSGSSIIFAAQRQTPSQGRSVGYQPITRTPNFGALLEIRPTLAAGDDRVTVDLKSTITVPGQRNDDLATDAAIASGMPAVDRIAIETQEFATTLRIPLGEPFLVGGMTYAPTSGNARGTEDLENTGEKPQLYLVLEVR